MVKILLRDPRVDPSDRNNEAIRWASKNGHESVVEILLKDSRVDPSDRYNEAIRVASEKGHLEVVKLLLFFDYTFSKSVRVDPSAIIL